MGKGSGGTYRETVSKGKPKWPTTVLCEWDHCVKIATHILHWRERDYPVWMLCKKHKRLVFWSQAREQVDLAAFHRP